MNVVCQNSGRHLIQAHAGCGTGYATNSVGQNIIQSEVILSVNQDIMKDVNMIKIYRMTQALACEDTIC